MATSDRYNSLLAIAYDDLLGQLIHYGVDSMDDEQAFHAFCPLEDFLNSEGNWWMQVNLSDQALLIREFIEQAIGQNSR
ncbi:hypothetical protein V2H45_08180 [Tumidithrix elongata RA019]|uniref:DUF2007 domain-containing protein n=1 Tax=Tumidithrix elongata BACA0141 TaxID=2716417 RepID=A0AAW9PRP8_9CYAN|nr:hypothetical protein [Tumidithrix elongata RA019]